MYELAVLNKISENYGVNFVLHRMKLMLNEWF